MTVAHELTVGFSPCPNDTFMFHGLVHGDVGVPGIGFRPFLFDIEELNQRTRSADRFDVTKLSVPALAAAADDYAVLGAGAALGRGVGPLVVRNVGAGGIDSLEGQRIAVPGNLTTALLLLRIFGPEFEAVPMRFDLIMPAVERGEVDAGLVIHESRFTFGDHGLEQVCDLGQIWEADTDLPIPLGLIAARRALSPDTFRAVEDGLRRSVQVAFDAPDRSRPWIRQHAQEMDDRVCDQHIALYVNEWSLDLGDEGRRAVTTLLQRGAAAGVLPADVNPWRDDAAFAS